MQEILEVLKETAIYSIKLLPILFITYPILFSKTKAAPCPFEAHPFLNAYKPIPWLPFPSESSL